MFKFYHRPEKLVRSYKRDGKWIIVEVRDELNDLRAFGDCNVLTECPQMGFCNVSLEEGLYFSEYQRWLYVAQAFVRKNLQDLDRLTGETLFHWDEFDSLDVQ